MTKTRLHRSAPAWLAALACLLGAGLARAQDEAVDSLPGSARPAGVNLSPEAPPTPPAPGGRAPSFGAPVDPNSFVFRLGGRFSAWSSVGFGHSLFEPTGGDAASSLLVNVRPAMSGMPSVAKYSGVTVRESM